MQRSLTAAEIADLPAGLVEAIHLTGVRLIGTHHPVSIAAQWVGRSALIVVRGDWIFWPDLPADMSGNARLMSLLAHELVHVWQYQSGMTLWSYLCRERGQYYYELTDKPFTHYGYEQQAAMVEDWMRLRKGLGARYAHGETDKLAEIIPFV